MLKLKDLIGTLTGIVAVSLRDGKGEDLVITEPIDAKDLRDRILQIGDGYCLRFFDYHVLEMYAREYVIFLDEEVSCIQIILARC